MRYLALVASQTCRSNGVGFLPHIRHQPERRPLAVPTERERLRVGGGGELGRR